MVRLQVISDLHLETPKSYDIHEIEPKAPYLALLGDIGCTSHKDDYLGFLRRHLLKFKVVFLVMGNHEPYHSTWAKSRQLLRDFEKDIRNERTTASNFTSPTNNSSFNLGEFILLDRDKYTIPPANPQDQATTILGCTLFSNFPKNSPVADTLSIRLNDFQVIGDYWCPEDHIDAHKIDLAWLNEEVTGLLQKQHKVVVLTHHSPTYDSRAEDPRHVGSLIKAGFATDLSKESCWTSGLVSFWAFGHTHYNCDFIDGNSGMRIYTNQRGYYFQQSPGYDEAKVAEI